MAKSISKIQLRLPSDVKAWIESEAVRNGSSQNSEVIRALRDRMAKVGSQST
ncbi:Arc family DNA-binding protein [Roseivivax sp. THAF40]|uniref:Arc family DNA-binding protein n=1 Tax=Roseivivax sp. THAF40 TaxID=2587858 RepID=UPI0012687E22|nr:Arc family DNA-binding protein [Roseivivax sp. THAF40]